LGLVVYQPCDFSIFLDWLVKPNRYLKPKLSHWFDKELVYRVADYFLEANLKNILLQ
jgi:hypothetical protein